MANKSTQYIIDHYEMNCDDKEAETIESILKMNNGSDRAIVIENLKGWFEVKTPDDALAKRVYEDMLDEVDWNVVASEYHLDIIGRK